MTSILHLTHIGDIAMLAQAKGKIFWPNLRRDLREKYDKYKVEVSYRIIFENFIPEQQLE